MKRILFVCHGNICRSPMAEFVFKNLVKQSNLSDKYYIESAATSSEELGNPVYPPVTRLLDKKGISTKGKRARRVTQADYDNFDYIFCMDENNMRNISRILSDPDNKIFKLLPYVGINRDVADPWYTGNFEATYNDVLFASKKILEEMDK